MLKSSEKHTTRPTRLAERTSYLFLRDNGTDTTEYGYILWMVFNCFSFFFFLNHWPIVYQVHCFALLIRSVSFFGFWFIFALSLFHSCEFHFTIQPLCTPPQVRPHIHTYKPRTYHYDCCTISLLIRVVWGIKQAHAETK